MACSIFHTWAFFIILHSAVSSFHNKHQLKKFLLFHPIKSFINNQNTSNVKEVIFQVYSQIQTLKNLTGEWLNVFPLEEVGQFTSKVCWSIVFLTSWEFFAFDELFLFTSYRFRLPWYWKNLTKAFKMKMNVSYSWILRKKSIEIWLLSWKSLGFSNNSKKTWQL